MRLIIHGNDLQSSRNFYFETKSKIESHVLINGEKITFENFFQAFEGNSFFDNEKTVFIENLFSTNKSNSAEIRKISEYLNLNKKINIIIWEPNELSKVTLNLLKDFEIKLFSVPSLLFVFLDSLRPGNSKNSIILFNNLIKSSKNELVYFLMIRQFRLLLSISSGTYGIDEVKRLAPWQLSKFKSQASFFEKDKLSNSYKKLFEIESNHKTGKITFEINKSIDFFLTGL